MEVYGAVEVKIHTFLTSLLAEVSFMLWLLHHWRKYFWDPLAGRAPEPVWIQW
jgi:hypothetical protein